MLKSKLHLLIFLILIASCSNQRNEDNKMVSILSQLKVISNNNIFNKNEPFRLSYGTWKDSSSIRYFIDYREVIKNGQKVDYFNKDDRNYIQYQTAKAASMWSEQIGIPVYEVNTNDKSNMNIVWKFLENDGIGGNWALSEFPPTQGQAYKPYIICDLADMWKVVKDRAIIKKNYFKIILHEMGHALAGLRHGDIKELAVMNSNYSYDELQIDDVCGTRINYNRYGDFTFNGNTYTFISSNSTKNKTTNFKTIEFLSNCSYTFDGGHFLSLETINALQYIRVFYNCPIKVLSTYRNYACNIAAHGATKSQHLYRTAIDWKFIGKGAPIVQNKYENDIILKKPPLNALLRLGASGFGSYPYGYGTNHIDSRSGILWNRYSGDFGYMVWGEFNKKGSYYSIRDEFALYD